MPQEVLMFAPKSAQYEDASFKKKKILKKIKRRGNESYFVLAYIKVDNVEMKVRVDLEKAWKQFLFFI